MHIELTQTRALQILDYMKAVQLGHFVGTSDKHLAGFVSKDVPTRYPHVLRTLASGIAYMAGLSRPGARVVVAPPLGALALGVMVAEELGCEYAFLEKVDGVLVVKRPTFLEAVAGYPVGIVEDVITTAKTTKRSIAAVTAAGGQIAWVACLFNRGGVTAADLGVPRFNPLIDHKLEDWEPDSCVLCEKLVPINLSPGHGAKFQATHPGYMGGFV